MHVRTTADIRPGRDRAERQFRDHWFSHRRIRAAALLLALLSTLAFWPPALDRWVLPKVLVLGVAALIAMATPPTGSLPRWLVLGIAGAVLLLILAAMLGPQPIPAVMGRWPRYEGVVTATAYLLALWLGARLLGPGSGVGDATVLDRVLAGLAVVLALVSIIEAFGLRPLPSQLDRPGALLGNATDQGAVAAATAVVLMARLLQTRRSRRNTVVLAAAAALAALTVLVSGSRTALLALLVGALAAAALTPVAPRMRVLVGAAVAIPVAALAGLLPTIGPRLAAGDLGDRLLIWREALLVVGAHPVLGVGPSGFSDAVAAVHDVRWFTTVSDGAVLDSPHNLLLQALVVGGPLVVLGLMAALAALPVVVVRRVGEAAPERRAVVLPAALGAGVLLLVLLTHVSGPGTVIPAALLLGVVVAVPRTGPVPERRSLRLCIGVPTVVWLAIVSLALAGESALAAGVAAAREGRVADADAAFNSAMALRMWDVDTAVISAEALTARLDSGDTAALREASLWAARAWTAAPRSLSAGKSLVVTLIAGRELDSAAKVLEDLRETYPRDPWVAYRAGAVAIARQQLSEGESLLLLAIRLDPQRPEPWLALAYIYDLRGDTAKAAEAQARGKSLAEADSPGG